MEIDDQDDLLRFLQDRSPLLHERLSSVRECEVGWLLLLHMQYCQDHQDHRCGDPGPHVRRPVTGVQANKNQTLPLC